MAVLKNKTQKNFTIISNNVLRDKELSMKDRGVLCTICSLPDEWKFSISGLSAIVPDGVDAIRKSIFNLESQLKASTMDNKENIIESHILPYFKDKSLSEITSVDVLQWQNELLSQRDENGKGYCIARNIITKFDKCINTFYIFNNFSSHILRLDFHFMMSNSFSNLFSHSLLASSPSQTKYLKFQELF